jgi:glucosylceramidase
MNKHVYSAMRRYLYYILGFMFCNSCNNNPNGSSAADIIVDQNPNDSTGVEYWQTTSQANTLVKQGNIQFSEKASSFSIVLDSTKLFQEMDGFGAALTGSSAYLIKNMSEDKRQILLNSLFNTDDGIGISYLRLTIGSSDFSLGNYSYCDEPDISKFGIPSIDKRDLIPVLKEIMKINPQISIMASPWSAPAWMKTSNSMNGGSLKQENMSDFAHYLVDYIQAMEQEGITIDAVTLQNEPQYETSSYPSMKMDWQQQNELIRDYVGPLFKANNINAKILIFDHNWSIYQYPINILADAQTSQYIAGTAFHGYEGNVASMSTVYNANKDKGIYFTEISGGAWSDDFNTNLGWNMENAFIGGSNNYAKTVLMWNLALNTTSGPTNGGCDNCRGVVTIHDDGSFYKNVEYYSIGHFSKFVRPKAHRVANLVLGNKPSELIFSTFLNEDNTKVVIACNNSTVKQEFTISCGAKSFSATLNPNNLATFKWK